MRRVSAVAAIAALPALVGCELGTEGPGRDLAERLPARDVIEVAAIDLDAAGEALGLTALRPLAEAPPEVARAIDLDQVGAVARGEYRPGHAQVTLLETEQPFEEVARALEGAGYARDGSVLDGASAVSGARGVVADGEDGMIVLAANRRLAAEVLDGESAGPDREALALLDEVEDPIELAIIGPGQGGSSCVRGLALGNDPADGSGELAIRVTGAASADSLEGELFASSPGLRPGEPEVEADVLRVPFSHRAGEAVPPELTRPIDVEALYDCRR